MEESNKYQKVKNIEIIEVGELKEYEHNPRKHGAKSIDAICEAIKQHGFIQPILVDQNNRIVSGHGRKKAAIVLGLKTVPCVRKRFDTDEEYVSAVLSDNKVQEASSWDKDELKFLMDFLRGPELEFEIPAGFTAKEVDDLFGHKHEEVHSSSDEADFGESGVVNESDKDDRALVKRKIFELTQKEHDVITSKLKAIKKEHGLKNEVDALMHALKSFKGLPKVVTKKSNVKES